MKVKRFNDFTGGSADKNLPGIHNMYAKADNMLIEHDKSIYSRDGFDILSSTGYQLTAAERVARLINFDFDKELLAVQNKQLQYLNAGVWTNLLGPSGNAAFPNNTVSSLIDSAQWNHHLFLASDSGDPVLKYYRDGSSNVQLRTAGLPKPAVTAVYPDDASKIAAAITLAINIKTQMKAHVDDFGVSPAAHPNHDVPVSTALGALVNPVDLATLIAYTKVLRAQYNAHVQDAKIEAQLYHALQSHPSSVGYAGYLKDPILNILTESSLPSDANLDTIDEVIRVLNDVRNKYTWHILAAVTHNNATLTSPGWGDHFIAQPAININKKIPDVSGNISTFTKYVNYLRQELNLHMSSALSATQHSFSHILPDTVNTVRMDDATDLCTAVAMLGNIYYAYGQHVERSLQIANPTFNLFRGWYTPTTQIFAVFYGVVTPGSAVITAVNPDPTSDNLPVTSPSIIKNTIIKGGYATPVYDWIFPDQFPLNSKVLSTTANSITMDQLATGIGGGRIFAFHWDYVHADAERNADAVATSNYQVSSFLMTLDPTLQDLSRLATLATNIAAQIKAHEISAQTEVSGSFFLFDKKPGYTYYNYNFTSGPTGEFLAPHATTSPGVDNIYPSGSGTFFAGIEKYDGQGYFEAGLTTTTYLYRYVYRYDYTVGTVSFIDRSEPSDVLSVDSFVSPADWQSGDTTWIDPIVITNIPVLTNASNQNWDTANISVEFYRTIANGSVYYLDKTLTNGTTNYSDYLDDTNLITKEALYTSGGQVGNGLPPAAQFIHLLEDHMYYAKGRILYQSLSDDPDSVPDTFFDTFEEDITGLSSTRSNLVVFSLQNVYRVDGQFDDLGQGFMRHEKIFDQTGCVCPQSPVKTEQGIFFFGKDGIYYTDGFQCFRAIANHDTFKGYTVTAAQRNAVQGVYNPSEKKLYWTVMSNQMLAAPDLIVVLDVHFGVQKDATPNTTFSGGFDGYSGFNPTALVVMSDLLNYGDIDGYVMKQTPGTYLDVTKDLLAPATSWNKRTVLWDFMTNHEDYDSPNFRKFFSRINTEWEQITNASIQIISNADKGRVVADLPIIRSRKLLDWGDPKIDWTSSVYTAKEGGVIDEFRRFPADGSLRSNYRAIEMRNAYCVVVASNIMGNINVANVSPNIWSATLLVTPTYKWPLYSVGYFLRIAGVDYPVTVRISDSIIQVDDTGLAPLSAQLNIEWELWGYPKNEVVKLQNFDVNYEFLGQQQKDYQGATSTDGGQN